MCGAFLNWMTISVLRLARCLPELNNNVGVACREALARAEVEGNASPAPIVDLQLHGNKSFRARLGADTLFLFVAGNGLAVDGAGRVLAANDGLRDHPEIERADGLQHFELFVAQSGGIEGSGRLDGNERSQLEHVTLNHVAQRTSGLIKAAAALHAQGFRGSDLDMVDIVAIP